MLQCTTIFKGEERRAVSKQEALFEDVKQAVREYNSACNQLQFLKEFASKHLNIKVEYDFETVYARTPAILNFELKEGEK